MKRHQWRSNNGGGQMPVKNNCKSFVARVACFLILDGFNAALPGDYLTGDMNWIMDK